MIDCIYCKAQKPDRYDPHDHTEWIDDISGMLCEDCHDPVMDHFEDHPHVCYKSYEMEEDGNIVLNCGCPALTLEIPQNVLFSR